MSAVVSQSYNLVPNKNCEIMKNLMVRFGLYSAIFLIAVGLASFYIAGGASADPQSYGTGEVIGYLSIVVSMIFVFVGIKKYRDDNLDGQISFGKALKVGSLIVLFPALAFALYNVVYVEFMDPDFSDKYYEYQVEKLKAEADPSEYETIEATMEGQREMFANIPFQTVVMFMTVYVIGFIVSVLSSIVLSRSHSDKPETESET
jgi:hypothetical protein